MIRRPKPERFRLRRTMMFMNAQKPGLIKDAYIYGCDSIMLDLEDAVAENQKDAARFSLYHALTTIDYGKTVIIVLGCHLSGRIGTEGTHLIIKGRCMINKFCLIEIAVQYVHNFITHFHTHTDINGSDFSLNAMLLADV